MIQSVVINAIEFTKGYHVGWSRSEEIIDHITILRGLIATLAMMQDHESIGKIINGELKATSLFPLHTCKGVGKLLVRLPASPHGPGIKKGIVKWSTLPAIRRVLEFYEKCDSLGGFPLLKSIEDGVVYECRDKVTLRYYTEEKFELVGDPRIMCIEGGDCEHICHDKRHYYEHFDEVHARIDRVSGSSDVYRLTGIKAHAPFWLAFISTSEAILDKAVKALRLLEDIGLGGYRSRGLGRFKLLDVKLADEDIEVLKKNTFLDKPGYVYLLGSYPIIEDTIKLFDIDRAYCYQRLLEGISGDSYNSYYLPVLRLLDVGSVVYLRKTRRELYYTIPIDVIGHSFKPIIVFNPVAIHAS
jgi:CRISPR-associated protein Csm4